MIDQPWDETLLMPNCRARSANSSGGLVLRVRLLRAWGRRLGKWISHGAWVGAQDHLCM